MFDLLDLGIKKAEALGGEFVEARFEDLSIRELSAEQRIVKDVRTVHRLGVGINVFHKGCTGYSFTVNLSKNDIAEAATRAFRIAKAASFVAKVRSGNPADAPNAQSKEVALEVKKHPRNFTLDAKKDLVMRIVSAAEEHGKHIASITTAYHELYGQKAFTNSSGAEISWEPLVLDLVVFVLSKGDNAVADGMDWYGGSFGLEEFDSRDHSPEALGENAAKWAVEKLDAKPAPAGKYRALCENMLTGVLAHESFGHMAEGDFVLSGMSPLTGKLGQQLGSENATIIDEGTPQATRNNGFWLPYDDQGVKTGKTVILDKGKLTSYLHSRDTASQTGFASTGNARAVNYNYPPIVRMRNTYFAPGDLSLDEALELLGKGIYAIRSMGGETGGEGTFTFQASRGFYVDKGEIKFPLRGVTLSGSMLSLLKNIEGATSELLVWSGYFGGCGKFEQFPLPVGLGGPHLVIGEVRFGGEGQ